VIIDDCVHAESCSGCVSGHIRQRLVQKAEAFFTSHGFHLYQFSDSLSTKFRTRSKLVVRRGDPSLQIGLFKAHTHHVLPIPQCLAHHDSINRVVDYIQTLPANLGYDEQTQQGDLRYLLITVERQTSCAQVCFVINASSSDRRIREKWIAIAMDFRGKDPRLFHSLYINYQPQRSNRVLGDSFEFVAGEKYLFEQYCQVRIPIGPFHFIQANPAQFEVLLHDLQQYINQEDRVAELYAGMGVIGLCLAPFCEKILAIEKEPLSFEAFSSALKSLPAKLREKVLFCVGDVERSLDSLGEYNTVLVDPPRKGLPLSLLKTFVVNKTIGKIIYISCHFPSLERDLEVLLQEGFELVFARSYRFFPGTDHIETLVVLKRKDLGERIRTSDHLHPMQVR
jgi:23S rRNA (uracil1939-C5)-methyltransferase